MQCTQLEKSKKKNIGKNLSDLNLGKDSLGKTNKKHDLLKKKNC